MDIHLQAVRIGELLLPICSCEQWFDQSRNIELRTNKTVGDETLPGNLGYDWGAQCTQDGNGTYTPQGDGTGTWHCPNPNDPSQKLPYALSDHDVKHMRAQVNNPANGWDDLANVLTADSEPNDATQVKGNYTHDDTAGNAAFGYDLTVPISMANDYNGYIATYREFQRGDHYRKALTGWGPHSSDYLASRLVTLGRQLKDDDPAAPNPDLPQDQQDEQFYAPKTTADLGVNDARATALGNNGAAAVTAYEAGLPDDGGDAEIVQQPGDIQRFTATFLTWNGGSNYTDNPEVKVQREVTPGNWEDYADQSGELPVTLKFPTTQGDEPAYASGSYEWHWTAHFEAFVAGSEDQPFNTGDRDPATPPGNYRFVVDGQRREGHAVTDYHLTSDEFAVSVWKGIEVNDFNLDPDGSLSFKVGPRSTYTVQGGETDGCNPLDVLDGGPTIQDTIGPVDYPDSYVGSDPRVARFICDQRSVRRDPAAPGDPDKLEWFCFTCSFRPWIDFGDADTAKVRITLANGTTEDVSATLGPDGRWHTPASRPLRQNESAQVLTGLVLDDYGNTNQSSAIRAGGTAPGDADGDGVLDGPDNCDFVSNPAQTDTDNDGVGDACDSPDPDGDGDGTPDASDQCPSVPGPAANQGCPIPPPTDTDGDGVLDSADSCPTVAGPPDNQGCPITAPPPSDTDGDGVPNAADDCPDRPGPIDNFGCPLAGSQQPPATVPSCAVRRIGTPGRDSLIGTSAGDLLLGKRGGDRIEGGEGPDCVFGGPGVDQLDGQGGEDLVRGGDGRDHVAGGDGDDVVSGGRGPDRIAGGGGNDSLRSVDGDRDRLDCGPGADRAKVGPGDRVRHCERIKRVKHLKG
jgi:hypothetical protein